MPSVVQVLECRRCLILDQQGPPIRQASAGRDLIEEAMNETAHLVAVPVERLDPAFFQLRTGILGEIAQKMVNYRITLAVLGDVSEYVAASDSLRDFVVECERGDDLLFVENLSALATRLAAAREHTR